MPLIETLADAVVAFKRNGPLRVAVDGVDGLGKTTLADRLGSAEQARGRPVIRASVDGFHNPREDRYRRGRDSPEGFYRDSYDLDALRRDLLDPLSPGGSGVYRTAVFDHATDQPVASARQLAVEGAVLILDGLFLHRRELRGYWDLSIFLDAPFEITIPRGASRGAGWGSPDPAAPSNHRYVGGQMLYLAENDPKARATIVIDYTNLTDPRISAWRVR
ncbi:MAG TPA: uridine kinase [Microvirga sp.]|nr:uridine kinase [Microvirga sp.]